MDPDKYLVRGPTPEGVYNLAVGEPFFLRKHLQFPVSFRPETQTSYPPYKGIKPLLDELGWMYPGKHVVVANGAKQALLATIYAFRHLAGKCAVYHEAPCWPTYPTLAKLSGLSFQSNPLNFLMYRRDDDLFRRRYISIKTAPNNPDGRMDEQLDVGCYDIWDAAYAHPVYDWEPHQVPYHHVSVWSAAKLLGFSGDRVGWLVTGIKEIADAAADYIEKTTSGVNTRSQDIVAHTLKFIRENKDLTNSWYAEARSDLVRNFATYYSCIGWKMENVGANALCRGMFAFFRVPEGLRERFAATIKDAGVLLVPGEACGMGEEGWYRMSMGNYTDVTAVALQLLQKRMPF